MQRKHTYPHPLHYMHVVSLLLLLLFSFHFILMRVYIHMFDDDTSITKITSTLLNIRLVQFSLTLTHQLNSATSNDQNIYYIYISISL